MASGYVARIVCLANSRKPSGRCVAGKAFKADGEPWVRPVSARPLGELSEEDRWDATAKDAELGDIIDITMKGRAPHVFQPENHLIDESRYWTYAGRLTFNDIVKLSDGASCALWLDGTSSYYGQNDKVPEAVAPTFGYSLRLIRVSAFTIQVSLEGGLYGPAKRRIRGIFLHNNRRYVLSVTDPNVEKQYFSGSDGQFHIGDAVLCISLGEPFHGFMFKLIAGVILP